MLETALTSTVVYVHDHYSGIALCSVTGIVIICIALYKMLEKQYKKPKK